MIELKQEINELCRQLSMAGRNQPLEQIGNKPNMS